MFGILDYLWELDYESNFEYPLQVEDFLSIVKERIKGNETHLKPINEYNYPFVIENENKCKKNGSFDDIRLLIVVKSAIKHTHRRNTIRNSWGYENRFSDVRVKRVFMVGSCENVAFDVSVKYSSKKRCQDIIDEENEHYGDIVQANFIDEYYNNTVKTMMSMKWTWRNCPTAQFIFFVDDDYYVSLKNLLKFVRNPFKYGDESSFYLNPFETPDKLPDGYDGRLYAGFVFSGSKPHRYKFSKWTVTLTEYPYSKFPPYVTAGAIVLSQASLVQMYYASLYTKHFRFDDIYVGLLAKRLNLTAFHSPYFFFWKKKYSKGDYKNVIASHGFDDSKELIIAWEQQKSLGFA
ncbi:Beta-1:3-galactosyltransferase brn-like protein [Leptotrombidium deliense]|uniref:Hexosyltransferase n=1 Tax=Leptotrombidium deliense TaxID=299467 RepID=A0A443SPG0_9ACAR|nr:Beta-1:3-galactosyltransferase brn-like protein [Leptotrombidium deliense]